jgi:hypothetical protein
MGRNLLSIQNISFWFKQAAANLFKNHSLHLLRYLQNSLRMQIHHLLGYNPSDIYKNPNQILKKPNPEIFHTNQDLLIVGNNNKLYRGRIDSCQIIPTNKSKEKKSKAKSNIDENNEKIKIDFDQIQNKTMVNEYLFEYLDWQTQFNEQVIRENKFRFFLFENFHFVRIYRMNFVKNYFNIGNQFYVKIEYVLVIRS